MRFRHIYITVGSFFVVLLWVITDPDLGIVQNLPIGGGTIATLLILLKTILYIGMLHVSRRAIIDYIDFKTFLTKAFQTPEGAGLATIAIGLIFIAISITILAATS